MQKKCWNYYEHSLSKLFNDVDNTGNLINEISFTISTTTDSVIDLILIETPEQLDSVRDDLSAVYFLKADIDLSGYNTDSGWTPLGNDINRFTRIFYGNGHIIRNLYINSTDNFQGLFGIVNGGEIKDLGLLAVKINANNCTGGLVGYNYKSIIENCYTRGSVNGNDFTGGLTGNNHSSTITDCYTAASVKGNNCTGGFVGQNIYSTITNCYSTGSVNSKSKDTGGFTGYNEFPGYNEDSLLKYCYASGSVNGNTYTGGLVGYNLDTITNCYATGSTSGNDYTGGLVGDNKNGVIIDSFYNYETTGQGDTGKGIQKITTEMKLQQTYTGIWDFTDICR